MAGRPSGDENAGRAPGAIPRENVAEKNRPHLEPVVLDEQAMAAFDEVAALDEMVFKAAEAHGILPGLERETADRLFTETAQRLAYILPS